MKQRITFFRKHHQMILAMLILFECTGIAFCNHAFALKDFSIPVWSETLDMEMTLHKEGLSDNIEIASSDPILKFLQENENKIEILNKDLAEAEGKGKNKEEIDALRKNLKEVEAVSKNPLSFYVNKEETIKVIIKPEYTGPIYFTEKREYPGCIKTAPLFFFEAEGGIEEKIRICEIKKLSNKIEARLSFKNKHIEIEKNGDVYRFLFDKAKDIKIRFKGKLSGKADLKYGVDPQTGNPITFSETQAPAGGSFKIKIPKNKINEGDRLHVFFVKGAEFIFSPSIPVWKKQKPGDTDNIFNVIVPEHFPDHLKGDVRVAAMVINKDGEIKTYNSHKFTVRSQWFAIFLGIICTLIATFLICLLCTGDRKTWWKAPLDFTVTPFRRYSVSLLQILIWTTITIFSYIYVYYLKGEFLFLTNQILILLGISGATALSSKATAIVKFRDIPEKYFKKENGNDNLRDCKREPKFSDYISIGGIPNIFKFQIFGFTLITGIIVVWEL